MRPSNLTTKIFLDSGDPGETKKALGLLGFLDGQTTNPSLVSKNPEIQKLCDDGSCTPDAVNNAYKAIVQEIKDLIPKGSVSIEVYANQKTTSEEMFRAAKTMNAWIKNPHIKFPTTAEGIMAAHQSVKEGMNVNMTLCFTQEQAAAVHLATKGAKPGQVFVSPFIGRLDDRGENGMNLISNITKMYTEQESHVQLLVASVRNIDHFLESLRLGADIITAPLKILQEWASIDMKIPDSSYSYQSTLAPIPFKQIDFHGTWDSLDLSHSLVDEGIEKFVADWNQLLGK